MVETVMVDHTRYRKKVGCIGKAGVWTFQLVDSETVCIEDHVIKYRNGILSLLFQLKFQAAHMRQNGGIPM
jgi:hypothetical protein